MPDDMSDIPLTGRIIFPIAVKKALYQQQRGRCNYRGRTHRIGYLEIDHMWPVSRGGTNELENLQLLCIPCNMRKGIQTDDEFRDRYWRLLPEDDSIPTPPIPQEVFSEETQLTRASREVRQIFYQRFSQYRRGRGGCGLLVVLTVLLLAAIVIASLG